MIALGEGWRGVYTHEHTYAYDKEKPQEIRFNCLYDKKQDPWQNKNLFGNPLARALQDAMHRLTHQLMARYEDTFVPGSAVNKACFGEQGMPLDKPGENCVLPGRPIDLIRNARV